MIINLLTKSFPTGHFSNQVIEEFNLFNLMVRVPLPLPKVESKKSQLGSLGTF